MPYKANTNRYQKLIYRRCGNSGLLLPPITLGLWHNFGGKKSMTNESKKMLFRAFDSCLLYTSPSPRDQRGSRMPGSG